MPRPHAKRIRWQAVALLAASFSLVLSCVLLFGAAHPPRLAPPDPLDFANPNLVQ